MLRYNYRFDYEKYQPTALAYPRDTLYIFIFAGISIWYLFVSVGIVLTA